VKIYECVAMLLIVLSAVIGCTNNEDFTNPFDPENLRTSGSPVGLTLTPGDGQVKVSWQALELDGIAKYRIYRRFTDNPNAGFELVGEVDASATEFIDTKDIINDAFDENRGERLAYEYRLSYIDANGVETPDPKNPPSPNTEPLRVWPIDRTTPSNPPPIPNVILGDPTDLTVKLFWDDYQFPDDFELFRVFAAIPQPDRPLEFRRLNDGELTRDKTFYFDRGLFNDRITGFTQDNITKIYRIIAIDRFGVESVKTVEAASPNLPPSKPRNVVLLIRARSLFNNKYDALLSWSKNDEPDLAGYQIYATKEFSEDAVPDPEVLVPRRRADRRDTNITISGEDPIRVGQELVIRRYFITAFDDTEAADGTRDESELTEAIAPRR
jgi:hypothetical protein